MKKNLKKVGKEVIKIRGKAIVEQPITESSHKTITGNNSNESSEKNLLRSLPGTVFKKDLTRRSFYCQTLTTASTMTVTTIKHNNNLKRAKSVGPALSQTLTQCQPKLTIELLSL